MARSKTNRWARLFDIINKRCPPHRVPTVLTVTDKLHISGFAAHCANPDPHGVPSDARFYFVHSYAGPVNAHTVATATHGAPFAAVVQRGNFAGVQFHPERSGAAGARLLRNFLTVRL